MTRALFVLALTSASLFAGSPATLREAAAPGDCTRVGIELAVDGKLKVDRGGAPEAVPLSARASIAFDERVESLVGGGRAGNVARHYAEARSVGDTGLERAVRQLGPDRRAVRVSRAADGVAIPFAPAGPLTREELELVAEHFDPGALAALLPPTPVTPNATWPIPADAAGRLLHFDGPAQSELVGTLAQLTPEAATIAVAGRAEGRELGAAVRATVRATATFDRKRNLITRLEWVQDDVRSQGPASPATELTAKITLTRAPLGAVPPELARVPAGAEPRGANALLRYADPRGRYEFVYPREWRVVGRTADHLTLRLVESGEFVAQATVTVWKSAAPGSHTPPAEFQALLTKLPGWQLTTVTSAGEVPTDAGRWLYRVAAAGTQEGLAVAQTFYLLAGPGGEQVAVTVVCQPGAVAKLGVRDAQLVNGVEFPPRR